jgi:hypothetical protein
MAEKDFLKGSLRGLLKIIETATVKEQPSEAVLKAYLELMRLRDAPTVADLQNHSADHKVIHERLRKLENAFSMVQRPRPTQTRRQGGIPFAEEEG